VPGGYRSTARNLVIRASRQVEKSTFLANRMVYDAYRFPGIQILFVSPRIDQAHLFSSARLQPVIWDSPILRRRLWPHERPIRVRDIRFHNGSRIFIRSAFHSADGCRGISADELFIDEFQDAAPGSLEVLKETLSHSARPQTILTGTPKMLENHLETMFRQSTGCEWKVTCPGCNQPHVLDEHVLGADSLICPHCRHPLDARTGAWVPRNPHSTWGNGFTINHLMVPWLNIYDILERQRTYDRARFVNEVLGRPTTLGDHIITREEAEACCEDRPFAATLPDVPLPGRGRLVAGIDWGGGSASGTVLVLGYLEQGRRFRVLRFDRWQPHEDPNLVLQQVAQRCRQFQVQHLAADGGGNGQVYNRLLVRELANSLHFCSMYYSTEKGQGPVRDGVLWRWTIERSQAIGALFTRIKAKLLSFPRVVESGTFLDELTCELAEYDEVMRCTKYTKPENERDDALHAIVYAESLALRLAASMVA
jgi:phage terminase large subunit GpA-like protein